MEVPGDHDYTTEIHPQAEAFLRTVADRLVKKGVAALDPRGKFLNAHLRSLFGIA